jgi:acyl-CoA synthetase (NDP forming)
MKSSHRESAQEKAHNLERLFHPGSVVVVGALSDAEKWYIRQYYIAPLLELGYKGRIYAVDSRGKDVPGAVSCRSVREVPGPVDLVVGCLSARRTPGLVAECREAGVRFVQIFSAGFAETGEPEGMEAQRRLKAAMGADGPRIVGPNCMGVYCPGSGLSFCADYPREPGPIALICQSGGITGCTVRAVAERGLRFSKVASFGNAVDVDECDLLAYLAHDPQTKVIAAYIEGTKDGARFAEVLRAAAAAKPVVILKGGATDAGVRAAGSHTGALAGSDAVWDGLFRDAGVIRTSSVEETADMLVALLRMRPPRGTSTCLLGNGGGPTVLSTDDCERAGFRIAPMPEVIRQRLLRFVPAAGTMVRNPFDANGLNAIVVQDRVAATVDALEVLRYPWETVIKKGDLGWGDLTAALDDWPGLDLAIFHCPVDNNPMPVTEAMIAAQVGPMMAAARQCGLPSAMVIHFTTDERSRRLSHSSRQVCHEKGIPLFASVGSAALAIRRLMEFDRAHPGTLDRLRGG